MANKLKVAARPATPTKYYYADGSPHNGPVHTGLGQVRRAGLICQPGSPRVYTLRELLIEKDIIEKNNLLKINPDKGETGWSGSGGGVPVGGGQPGSGGSGGGGGGGGLGGNNP